MNVRKMSAVWKKYFHDIRFCLHAFWSCIPFCCCSLQLRLLLCKNLEVFIGNPSKLVFLDFTCIALFNMFRNVYMISFKIYLPLWILPFCTDIERYTVYWFTKMIKIIFIRKSVEAGSSFSNSGLQKKKNEKKTNKQNYAASI